jgi:phosphoglycolate phosphatase
MAEALRELRTRGANLYLCTAKPEVFARRIVAHFGFDVHLDGIYGANLDGAFDDKARLMAHLLERERIDPARAVMIGDREHDVRAARANGVRAVGVLWGYGSAEELAGADACVATPAELVTVLLGFDAASTRAVG